MSHLSDIGFNIQNSEGLGELFDAVNTNGENRAGENCRYKFWSIDPGIELWLSQVISSESDKKLQAGFQPHFRGKTKNRIKIAESFIRNPIFPSEGSYVVWANQEQEEEGPEKITQEYPYVFDSADYLLNTVKEGEFVDVQITAFADEFKAYVSIEEYKEVEKDMMLAPQAFIPSGMFKPGGEETNPPDARAIISGVVKEVHDLVNSYTNAPFVWLVIESLDAEYDVVVDKAMLNEMPQIGGVVFGAFWLSGKILKS